MCIYFGRVFIQNTLLLECNSFQFIQSKRHIFINIQLSPFIENVRKRMIFEVGISWFDYKSNNVYILMFSFRWGKSKKSNTNGILLVEHREIVIFRSMKLMHFVVYFNYSMCCHRLNCFYIISAYHIVHVHKFPKTKQNKMFYSICIRWWFGWVWFWLNGYGFGFSLIVIIPNTNFKIQNYTNFIMHISI